MKEKGRARVEVGADDGGDVRSHGCGSRTCVGSHSSSFDPFVNVFTRMKSLYHAASHGVLCVA